MTQPDDTFPKESNTELKRQREDVVHAAEVLREEYENEDEWTNQETACSILAKDETERFIERETRKFLLQHPDPKTRPPLPLLLSNPQIKYGEIYAEYMALSAAIASAMEDRRDS